MEQRRLSLKSMADIEHTAVSIFQMKRLPPCSLTLWHFGSSEKKLVQTKDVVDKRQFVQTRKEIFPQGNVYFFKWSLNGKLIYGGFPKALL